MSKPWPCSTLPSIDRSQGGGTPQRRRLRARRLDEGLDILTALWRGEPVTYHGEHYRLEKLRLEVLPLQAPRVPIWAAAAGRSNQDGVDVGSPNSPGDVRTRIGQGPPRVIEAS